MKKAVLLPLFCVILSLISCNTAGYRRGSAGLNGMVYDFENKPIPQYIITVDEKTPVSTDINGRFFVPRVRMGKHEIKGYKDGYESYTGALAINDRRQIVYLRVPNVSQLLGLADAALSKNNIEEAAVYIQRAGAIGEKTAELFFYSAVVLFRQGEYRAAIEKLQDALSFGFRDEYVVKFLNDLTERYGE
jgi:tetratricopeptide (TPR) repeat protein